MNSSRHIVVAGALFLALLAACATTGPGGKKSLIVIGSAQEVSIGDGMAQELATTEKALPDSQWQAYLNEVGQKVVAVCDRRDITYSFTVIESDQINAFAIPGGHVYFYTGLLREMKGEDEMAAVMAHEISHVVARHGVKRLQQAMGVALAYELVFGGKESSQALTTAIQAGMGLIFAGYSRSNEREADSYGLHYLVKAGYHPQGMLNMFETLSRLGGGGAENVFDKLSSSHPDTQERIANTRRDIAALQPLPTNLVTGEQRYQTMLRRLPAKK
jgi:predicted Zn-dependent protease